MALEPLKMTGASTEFIGLLGTQGPRVLVLGRKFFEQTMNAGEGGDLILVHLRDS